ncbi:hypothetical protein, partial [Kocuria arenosa]|uniref:hypothetical protein n=1 Tax=Kocuria arenosa TaxID=3071446 RepID=UPI0034D48E1A
KFFELQSKIQQYLKSEGEMAAALQYNQIWNGINAYIKEAEIDLADAETSIDSLMEQVDRILELSRRRMLVPMEGDGDFIEIG